MIWFRKRSADREPAVTPPGADDPLDTARRLAASGRAREAVIAFEAAGAAEHPDAEVVTALAQGYFQIGDLERAGTLFDRALALRADLHAALLGRAETTFKRGDFAQATAQLDAALDTHPGDVAMLRLYAVCQHHLGRPDVAETILARLTSADPDDIASWDLLGVTRLAIGGPHAARPAFAQVRERGASDPRRLVSPHNYAITLTQVGEVEAALDHFEHALPERPDAYGFFTYAMALLRRGAFRLGWRFYEFRWMTREFLPVRPSFGFPPWTGQDVAGKTVMLLGEQGFGDTIQFIRYARLLHERGAIVVAIVRKELVAIVASAPGVSRCADRWDDAREPDFFAHVMSLPRVFGTTLATVPRDVPYLAPSPEAITRWRGTLGTSGRKIGLVWAGNPKHAKDRYRSLALDAFGALATLPDTALFCLHNVAPAPEVAARMADYGIVDLAARLTDFDETAAAIAELDLVVSVDTSVAHLAGALGKPIWLVVSDNVDFRWMDGVEASPWYPTLRLFRQQPGEAWADVVGRIAAELAARTVLRGPAPIVWVEHERAPAAGLADIVVTAYGTLAYLPDGGEEATALATCSEWRQGGLDALLTLLTRGATVLEVFPGVGSHAVAIARAIGVEGHFLAVETRQPQRLLLTENLETNGIRGFTLLDDGADAGIDACAFERLDLVRVGASSDATATLARARDTLWRLRPAIVLDATLAPAGVAILSESGYDVRTLRMPMFRAANFAGGPDDVFAGAEYSMVFALPEEADGPAWFAALPRT